MSGNGELLYDRFGGKRVFWEYVKGKGLSDIRSGEGVVAVTPRVGNNLYIIGDNGMTTSEIVDLREEGDTLVVTTRNSVYNVTLAKRSENVTSK